jgi:hypothetical protein
VGGTRVPALPCHKVPLCPTIECYNCHPSTWSWRPIHSPRSRTSSSSHYWCPSGSSLWWCRWCGSLPRCRYDSLRGRRCYRGATDIPIHTKAGRRGIARCPGAIETGAHGSVCSDIAVIARAGNRDVLARLQKRAIPSLGDRLTASRERPGQGPARPGRGAGVLNDAVSGETTRPLIDHAVSHLAVRRWACRGNGLQKQRGCHNGERA